jgi:hypothetical protein
MTGGERRPSAFTPGQRFFFVTAEPAMIFLGRNG